MTCDATQRDRGDFAAIAWIDAFERIGGRVWSDGHMFALTPPAETDIDLGPPEDLMAVARAAFIRERRRMGFDPFAT